MSIPTAEDVYVALIGDPTRTKALRRLTYRCSSRCLLLDAIEVGHAVIVHQKRFKESERLNRARSVEASRVKHTADGDRHWLPSTYYLSESALARPVEDSGQALHCDHVGAVRDGSEVLLTSESFARDWVAGLAEVCVRTDGTLYAIR